MLSAFTKLDDLFRVNFDKNSQIVISFDLQILKASATELKVDFEKTLSAFQNFLRQFFFPAKISRLFFTGKR